MARQFLCESLLICGAGSVLDILLARTMFRVLATLAPGNMTGLNSVSIDVRVLAFTTALAVIVSVVFGLIPLFQARRVDLIDSLKQNARTLRPQAPSTRAHCWSRPRLHSPSCLPPERR